MKISEMINELQGIMDRNGDIPVKISTYAFDYVLNVGEVKMEMAAKNKNTFGGFEIINECNEFGEDTSEPVVVII